MADPATETIWRFEDHRVVPQIEDRLRMAQISYKGHSSTVSYSLRNDGHPWLESYELHASYSGRFSPKGEPEVEKSYVRNSYGIIQSSEGSYWVAESAGQPISEEEFYRMALYAQPDRVISLQQISFATSGGQYILELNLESRLLVLIALTEGSKQPGFLADMLQPDALCRSSYLLELFEGNGGSPRS